MERELGRLLLLAGVTIAFIGLVVLLGNGPRLGRLPGDISISRGGLRIYLPLGTCLVISVLVTIVMRILTSR